jgi:hypothetical protein
MFGMTLQFSCVTRANLAVLFSFEGVPMLSRGVFERMVDLMSLGLGPSRGGPEALP